LKARAIGLEALLYPVVVFLVAVFLLIGLGIYQRLSSLTEHEVREE
jgi:hypothetical protein